MLMDKSGLSIFDMLSEVTEDKRIPLSTTFEITYRCNLMCKHCYRVEEERDELEFDEIIGVIDAIADMGGLHLVFTGGEVFLRKDFLSIVVYAREKAFNVVVFTNGQLIDREDARLLKEVAINKVGMSLYGATAETHDSITGVDGSFEKTLRAFQILRDEGVRTELKCVLMRENVHEFNDIYRLAKEIGSIPSFDPIVTPKTNGDKAPLEMRMSGRMMESFYRGNARLLGMEPRFKEGRGDERVLCCNAGINVLSINPYGDIFPCLQLPIHSGNIRERPLNKLWEGSAALKGLRDLRMREIEYCKGCSIKGYCARCPGLSYLEDGDITLPSSTACELAGIFSKPYP